MTVDLKRLHDLNSTIRTLSMLANRLEEGYRFRDENAAAKVLAVVRAVEIANSELSKITAKLKGTVE